jgi:hypothetical protein
MQQLRAAPVLPSRCPNRLPPRSTGGSSSSTRRRPTAAAAAAHNSQSLQDPPSAYNELRQQLARQHQQAAGLLQQQQQQHGSNAVPGPPASSSRQWPRPADDVVRAVSRRLKQADSAQQVLGVVTHHASQFNAVSSQQQAGQQQAGLDCGCEQPPVCDADRVVGLRCPLPTRRSTQRWRLLIWRARCGSRGLPARQLRSARTRLRSCRAWHYAKLASSTPRRSAWC